MGTAYDVLVDRFNGNALTVGNMVDAFLYPTGSAGAGQRTWQLGQTQFQTVADSIGFKGAFPWYDGYGSRAPDTMVTPDNLVAVSRAFANPQGLISHDAYHRIGQVPLTAPGMPGGSTGGTGGHAHGGTMGGSGGTPCGGSTGGTGGGMTTPDNAHGGMTDNHAHYTPLGMSNYNPYGHTNYAPRSFNGFAPTGYAPNGFMGYTPNNGFNTSSYMPSPYGTSPHGFGGGQSGYQGFNPSAYNGFGSPAYGASYVPEYAGDDGHDHAGEMMTATGGTTGGNTGGTANQPWGMFIVGWGTPPFGNGSGNGWGMPGNPGTSGNTNAALARLAGTDGKISAGDVIDFAMRYDVGGGPTGRYDNALNGREFGQAAATLGLRPMDFGALDGAAGRGRDGLVSFDDLIASIFTADKDGDGLLNAQEAKGWAASIRAGGAGDMAGGGYHGMGGAPTMPTPFPGMGWGWGNTGWGPTGGMPTTPGTPSMPGGGGHNDHSHYTPSAYSPAGGYAMGNGGVFNGFGYSQPSMHGPSNITFN